VRDCSRSNAWRQRALTTALIIAALSGCASPKHTASLSRAQDHGNVVDVDGNSYRTILIGDQWWFAEDLRCTYYADGTPITDGSSDAGGSTEPRLYRRRYESTTPLAKGGDIVVYNWAAVMRNSSREDTDPRYVQGPAPEGWHIPSQAEWSQLRDWLSVTNQGGPGKSAESKLIGLSSPSGFDALYVDAWFNGNFLAEPADQVNFWSSTRMQDNPVPHAYAPNLGGRSGQFLVGNGANVLAGWSVRCVKDKP